jgi:hypothetical protein
MFNINLSGRRFVFYATIIVALACYVVYLDRSGQFLFLTSSKQAVRHKLTEFYTTIPIGLKLDELKSHTLIFEPELSKLSISLNFGNRELRVAAPTEFPGFTTSWILSIYTDGQKVIGKQIRSAEGNFVSCTAPADEGVVEMQARLDIACSNY